MRPAWISELNAVLFALGSSGQSTTAACEVLLTFRIVPQTRWDRNEYCVNRQASSTIKLECALPIESANQVPLTYRSIWIRSSTLKKRVRWYEIRLSSEYEVQNITMGRSFHGARRRTGHALLQANSRPRTYHD